MNTPLAMAVIVAWVVGYAYFVGLILGNSEVEMDTESVALLLALFPVWPTILPTIVVAMWEE